MRLTALKREQARIDEELGQIDELLWAQKLEMSDEVLGYVAEQLGERTKMTVNH